MKTEGQKRNDGRGKGRQKTCHHLVVRETRGERGEEAEQRISPGEERRGRKSREDEKTRGKQG